MTSITTLAHRSLVRLTGPDWAPFLKGLCTAHIDDMSAHCNVGEHHKLYYGAFLRPQGKLICDVLLHTVSSDEVWLDIPLSEREEIMSKLNMYRLRAKVSLETLDCPVSVAFGGEMPAGFMVDPRSVVSRSAFGMAYGPFKPTTSHEDWRSYRIGLGLSDPGLDFLKDQLYAIDANLDLLGAIDFHKGCYIGQELTSRMKRRGQIKNRILPFVYAPPQSNTDAIVLPVLGEDILSGERRCGEILAMTSKSGLGLMRIDRLTSPLHCGHLELDLCIPEWIAPHLSVLEAE